MKIKRNKGFTLIELLVVISIIGFLASIVLASLNIARSKGRDAQRLSDLHQLQNALELYRNAHGGYPVCNSPLGNGWCSGCGTVRFGGALDVLMSEGDIQKIPTDPTNQGSGGSDGCYTYEYSSGANTGTTCGGVNTSNFVYTIRFELENPVSGLPAFSYQRSGHEYCMTMQ